MKVDFQYTERGLSLEENLAFKAGTFIEEFLTSVPSDRDYMYEILSFLCVCVILSPLSMSNSQPLVYLVKITCVKFSAHLSDA
jgi:hypothetical protein